MRGGKGGKVIVGHKKMKKKKKPKIVISESDDEGEEGEGGDSSGVEVAGEGGGGRSVKPQSKSGNVGAVGGTQAVWVTPGEGDSEVNVTDLSQSEEGSRSLVMRLSKRFCSTDARETPQSPTAEYHHSASLSSHAVPITPSSDPLPLLSQNRPLQPPLLSSTEVGPAA